MLDLARKEKISLWRIVPSFLRKPFKTLVAQEVTSAPPPGKVEGRSTGKKLRRSDARLEHRRWTYRVARDNRRGETEGQKGLVVRRRTTSERIGLERGSSFPGRGSSWQRVSSFPGRLGPGGRISKEEARRRLLGWRRTTSVRKVSRASVRKNS